MMAQRTAFPSMRALTLRLDDELFAIEANSVREILEVVPFTLVPNAPEAVFGLINVRGTVVPLADLRVLFRMERRPLDVDSRIIVMEAGLPDQRLVVGILADKVHEVTDFEADSLEPAPRIGIRWPAEYLRAVARREHGFVIVPDMPRIFQNLAA